MSAQESAQPAETDQRRAHHPDCPALFFKGYPERCRCIFLAMLDRPCPRGAITRCACGCGVRLPDETDPNVKVYASPNCYARSLRTPPTDSP